MRSFIWRASTVWNTIFCSTRSTLFSIGFKCSGSISKKSFINFLSFPLKRNLRIACLADFNIVHLLVKNQDFFCIIHVDEGRVMDLIKKIRKYDITIDIVIEKIKRKTTDLNIFEIKGEKFYWWEVSPWKLWLNVKRERGKRKTKLLLYFSKKNIHLGFLHSSTL